MGQMIAYGMAEMLSVRPTSDDVAAAETVNTAAMTSLANEDAYDDVMMYMDGRILATAVAGEPFQAEGGLDLHSFLNEMNMNLGGKSPSLRYKGPVNGWTPKGWAIAIRDAKPVVYITDGTIYNKVELQPNIDENYR